MNIENIVTEYNERIKEMRASLTETLRSAFKEIFAQSPNLYMITWTQYAPYFNDGDPCEFSVHEMYAVHRNVLNDENYDEDSLPSPYEFEDDLAQYRMEKPSDFYFKKYASDPRVTEWNSYSQEVKNEIEEVNKFLKIIASVDEDVFKAAFGEDNAIYVFADRIVTEDYSGNHD
jgi:hypothetical protein